MTEVNRTIWRDGELVPWAEATVHVLSQSLQRGSLAFDYMSVHDTPQGPAVLKLPEHIDRLLETCHIMGIPLSYGAAELIEGCRQTVLANPGATSLKISALTTSIEVELVPQDPHVAVFIAAYDSRRDVIDQNPGDFQERRELRLMIERKISNRREDIIPPQAKVAANYTAPMFAKRKARAAGYDDILLLDPDGFVAEATTSNLFAVIDGALVTPPAQRVLLGITRASVMELARAEGIDCVERDLSVEELLSADEVFLTATSIGVWPVVAIDDQGYGNGAMGPVTAQLQARHRRIVTGEDPKFAHWLTVCG